MASHSSISVIMPCFNHARFLRESVSSILKQSFADLELVVVDDCSRDASWDVIKELSSCDSRVVPIKHKFNQGASSARNSGLRLAKGEFIGFCDADDIWEEDKLRCQKKALESNPRYGVTYCDASIVDENGKSTGNNFSSQFPPPNNASGNLFGYLITRNFVNMPSVLMRSQCVNDSGYFDQHIKWVEDWWYWIKLSRSHRFLYEPEPLVRYRIHSQSTGVVQ